MHVGFETAGPSSGDPTVRERPPRKRRRWIIGALVATAAVAVPLVFVTARRLSSEPAQHVDPPVRVEMPSIEPKRAEPNHDISESKNESPPEPKSDDTAASSPASPSADLKSHDTATKSKATAAPKRTHQNATAEAAPSDGPPPPPPPVVTAPPPDAAPAPAVVAAPPPDASPAPPPKRTRTFETAKF
jgi:hypothetical protein